MNILLRPIKSQDVEILHQMSKEAPLGFNTLPKDKILAEHRVNRSLSSFSKEIEKPEMELYIFVAEDVETNEVLGISAIESPTGGKNPLVFYRKDSIQNPSTLEHVVKEIPLLTPVTYAEGPAKLCSLYVRPQFRKSGVGKLLSFARFLFIASFPYRFTDTLFADLRGVIDGDHQSPFWEGTGRHFFDLPLDEVHRILEYGTSFALQFLPKYPIYICLLPKSVQEVVGKIDVLTEGAWSMLSQIGFGKTSEVDIFDGGPKVSAKTEEITVVKNCEKLSILEVKESIEADERYLIANERLDFRAKICPLMKTASGIVIDRATAKLLKLEPHDSARVYRV